LRQVTRGVPHTVATILPGGQGRHRRPVPGQAAGGD
jgi:hypothetical protein